MRNLKNNKAAQTGGIHPGLIKYGGNKLLNRIYELVRQRRKVWPWKGPFVEKRNKNTDAAGGGAACCCFYHSTYVVTMHK